VRLFVAFLFVALAALCPALGPDSAEERPDLRASAGSPCLQQVPPPTAPADPAIRADISNAPSSQLRWTALASFAGMPAPDLAARTLVRDRSARPASSPQFRRFPLLI
jgi:hypothetical protein